jgi:hypothetical protein
MIFSSVVKFTPTHETMKVSGIACILGWTIGNNSSVAIKENNQVLMRVSENRCLGVVRCANPKCRLPMEDFKSNATTKGKKPQLCPLCLSVMARHGEKCNAKVFF